MECLFVSHGPFGIVDLGASQTVIGIHQVKDLLQHLPQNIRRTIKKVPCRTIFRFGNNSSVPSDHALLVPLRKWYVRICVVPSQTPFLISNNAFRTLGAKIDTATDSVEFARLGIDMDLELSEKKLYLLDFCSLVRQCSHETCEYQGVRPIMHVVNQDSQPQDCKVEPLVESSENLHSKSTSLSRDNRSEAHHVDVQEQHQQSGRSPPSCDTDSSTVSGKGRVLQDVLRGAVSAPDHFRRSEAEPEVHRCAEERPQVRSVVRPEVCFQSEAQPSLLPVLHEPLCGASGVDTRAGTSHIRQEQEQETRTCAVRGGQSGELVRCRTGTALECGISADSRGDQRAESANHEHGEHSDPDRPAAADTDRAPPTIDPLWSDPDQEKCHDHDVHSKFCDELGIQQLIHDTEKVLDPEHFVNTLANEVPFDNWVYQEMWTYFQKSHPNMNEEDMMVYLSSNKIHVLEVYCSDQSQLTYQGSQLGLITARFGLRQGDLSTFKGRCALYDMLWNLRPQHVWMSPKCGPWSAWNRLNAQKSLKLAEQIRLDRTAENVHLLVCDVVDVGFSAGEATNAISI